MGQVLALFLILSFYKYTLWEVAGEGSILGFLPCPWENHIDFLGSQLLPGAAVAIAGIR